MSRHPDGQPRWMVIQEVLPGTMVKASVK
jgi:hypothetical protein